MDIHFSIKRNSNKGLLELGDVARERITKPFFIPLSVMDWFGGSSVVKNIKYFIEHGYASNPYIYAIINDIASTGSRFKINLQDKNGNQIKSNEVYDKIFNQNSVDYKEEFLYKILAYLEATGNVFILKEKAIGFSKPVSYKVLNSGCMVIKINSINEIDHFEYSENGKTIKYSVEEIIHIKHSNIVNLNEKAYYGFAPLESSIDVLQASNSLFATEKFWFKNAGVVGIVSGDVPGMSSDITDVQKEWENMSAGENKQGKVLFSGGKVNYTAIGTALKDLQLYQQSVAKLKVFCAVYGVPSVLYGDDKASTYSNVKEAYTAFYTKKMLPLMNFVLNSLSLEMFENGERMVVDVTNIKELNSVDVEFATQIREDVKAGIITPQEAKELRGY